MRAAVCHELGPPDVLVVESSDDLVPGPGRVVVDVAAAGVNYVDALFVAGSYQIKPRLPFVPGSEVAGTVRAVGEGVDTVAPGDRVLGMCGLGGYATQVDLSPAQLLVLPDELPLDTAAAFPQSYATALYALGRRAQLAPDEVVLVLGAGGGVGQAAIDVAVSLGARAIGVASTAEKRSAATRAGAFAVIDPATDDVKVRARELAGGDGVDVVVDTVGGDLAEPALRALRYRGRYLVIGFASGPIPRLPLNQVLLRNRSVLGIDWGAWSIEHADDSNGLLAELLAMVEGGRLHPPAPTTYPLDEVARALDDLLGRRVTGKVVLDMGT